MNCENKEYFILTHFRHYNGYEPLPQIKFKAHEGQKVNGDLRHEKNKSSY